MSLSLRAAERRERRAQEMARGRKTTTMHMAEGILDQLASEFRINRTWFTVDFSDDDARNWTITLAVPDTEPITENFFVFPSPEVRAAIALMTS
jgi:hypothetical protein